MDYASINNSVMARLKSFLNINSRGDKIDYSPTLTSEYLETSNAIDNVEKTWTIQAMAKQKAKASPIYLSGFLTAAPGSRGPTFECKN